MFVGAHRLKQNRLPVKSTDCEVGSKHGSSVYTWSPKPFEPAFGYNCMWVIQVAFNLHL